MITRVSDVFAFVLENGEFTEAILFAEGDEIEELKPEERAAADAVLRHVDASYVGLLTECRQAFLDAAKGSALDANRKTLEANKSRPSTIWDRGMTQVPLLIEKSWTAWVSFVLLPSADDGRPIKLGGHITTQRRRYPLLQRVLDAHGIKLRPVWSGHGVEPVLPKEGQSFRDLAEEMARRTVPIAIDLYVALTAQKS
jgi:hypothetical protein